MPSAQASYVTKHLGFSYAVVFIVELLESCAMLVIFGQQYTIVFDTSCITWIKRNLTDDSGIKLSLWLERSEVAADARGRP